MIGRAYTFELPRLADWLRRRVPQIDDELATLGGDLVHEREVATALADFDVVWDCLAPRSSVIAPLDFTLHDEDHSFRVAERAAEILPASLLNELSGEELALLLLSSYLHDIGMSPSYGLVDAVRRQFHDVGNLVLPEDELANLQTWLDESHVQVEIGAKQHDESKARELSWKEQELLATHYCRHRHNDWSENWIRENISQPTELYWGWKRCNSCPINCLYYLKRYRLPLGRP